MSPSITLASPADLPAVLDLLQSAKLPSDGIEGATTLIVRERGRLVGCVALEMYGESALLRSVAVDAAQQGRGLGIQLTNAALTLARARGTQRIYLLTETAGKFFPRFGFRPTTREAVDPAVRQSVEFTTACPATALVMELALS